MNTKLNLVAGVIVVLFVLTNSVIASPLPKGNCADPKPYTNLNHCRFEKADLRNKDLRGVDLRYTGLVETQLQGANLTDALFDGMGITHAYLDDVVGLSTEALAIFKNAYLAKSNGKGGFMLSVLPKNYQGSMENIVGLDNLFMVQRVANTQTTIALLSNPRYGETLTFPIFARYDNDKFSFPICYQSVDLRVLDGHGYYWPRWKSMKVRSIKDGSYLIAVMEQGNDGDDEGISQWQRISILKLTPECKLQKLHQEFIERGGNWIAKDGGKIEEWCGGEMDYCFIDDQTAEIKMTYPVSTKKICGEQARATASIAYKKINLNSPR